MALIQCKECEKENILSFNSQIERVRSFGVTSIEVPICSTNVIVGQKINQNEIYKKTVSLKDKIHVDIRYIF